VRLRLAAANCLSVCREQYLGCRYLRIKLSEGKKVRPLRLRIELSQTARDLEDTLQYFSGAAVPIHLTAAVNNRGRRGITHFAYSISPPAKMADTSLQVISFPRTLQSLDLTKSPQERLREHAEAFDGLLSLIPAKHYYGKDNSVCTQFAPCPEDLQLIFLFTGPIQEEEANQRASRRSKTSKA